MKGSRKWHERSFEEVKELFEIWSNIEKRPLLFGAGDLLDFTEKIKISKGIINESENPRLIVLETWLIIDFTIRHLLTTGLQLNRFGNDDFSFLPPNTRECIKMLQQLIKDQRNKPSNPSKKGVYLPSEMLSLIMKDKTIFDAFLKYELQYYKNSGINISDLLKSDKDNQNYRNVSDSWLKVANQLSESWFKSVEKINNVRNKAAHSFDEDKIFSELGINGKNKLYKLKEYCNKTLSEIIGLK